jgi:hypothetical protein
MSIIGTTPNGVPIVSSPDSSLLESVEFSMSNANASVVSPFTGQTQVQQWMGADSWSGTMTLPPLTQDEANLWSSFLMQCRGMANCFFLSDPLRQHPTGYVDGTSAPVIDLTVGTTVAGSQLLYTRGWKANAFGLLLPGDNIQIGSRLHRVLDAVNSDATGSASFEIAPSLREMPTDGEPLILKNPAGLFRLATNKTTWSADASFLSHMSFPVIEYR